jgi:hypothetical protein
MAATQTPSGDREGTPRRVLSYSDWTKLLCEHFFRKDRASHPVTFFVDDDLVWLLEGSGDPDAGVASLTAAVRTRLAPDSYGRRFTHIDNECTKWKVDGACGCPPSLPLLAVAVLAGTRMAREEGIAATNYWRRFRDLLELNGPRDLKGREEVFPGLWDQLAWWLDTKHEGRLGRSTIQEDPWWTIIGYALSQALFRESDRQHLTDLFRKLGLAPDEQPHPRELLQYFKAWAPGSALSHGAKHMAADARYDERLIALLVDEASRWDGVLRDERGRKLGSLVLAYEPTPRPTYMVAAERPLGFPEQAAFAGGGAARRMTASIEGWYGETWPLDHEWLQHGLRLEADEFVLAYRPTPVVPLARNPVLGCWASVSRVEPGEKYVVLVDNPYADAVQTFLRDHARDEWKREADAFAPPGWVLFTGVVIEESLAEIPAGPLAALAPRLRERPTLRGGLLLDGAVALYLCGGEPDLWLPSLLDAETVVSIKGTVVEAVAGQRISLAARRMPAGAHEIAVGAATLRFSSTRDFRVRESPGAGTLGHTLARSNGGYKAVSAGATALEQEQQDGEVAVAGAHLIGSEADLPVSRPTIVLPLEARSYRLAGAAPGEVVEPRQPARPVWLDSAGDGPLFPIGFEVSPDFDAVWVVVERPGRTTARLRHPTAPVQRNVSPSVKTNDWCSVFDLEPDLDDDARDLWLQYRAVAAALPRLTAAEIARQREEQRMRPKPAANRQVPVPVQPKTELVIERLITLPLKYRTTDRQAYESRDKRFQVTYWPQQGRWTVTERLDERSRDKIRLGRFRTEDEALAAVKNAIHKIRTVTHGRAR